MKCPVDSATLLLSSRENIEIDYCPECRGVWLDRGELDKMIEASSFGARTQNHERPSIRPESEQYRQQPYHHKKKKESFLSDLFDF